MILVLKHVKNFIKIYKTLASALTHTCALCMHLICDKSSRAHGLSNKQSVKREDVGNLLLSHT